MFQTKVVDKIKTQISFSKKFIFLSDGFVVYEIMWKKYCRAGQATDDIKIGRKCFVISNVTDTLRICNTYCFSMGVRGVAVG
jgi:hypothetical protein